MTKYDEFLRRNTLEIQEFQEPFIKILFDEGNLLLNSYEWSWSEEDLCYYNENGDDLADAVYYDCDGYLCHPKLLAAYIGNYLDSKRRYDEV